MVGLSIDCRSLTKATCGIAIAGDQQSLIADLILDLGITKASKIAGAIQRKQEYLSTWVDAYQLYQGKCNQANSVKGTLKDRFVKAWDSWPAYTSVVDYDEWRFGSLESRSSLLKIQSTVHHRPRTNGENDGYGHKASRLENRSSDGSSNGIPHIRNVVLHKLLQEPTFHEGVGGGEEPSNLVEYDYYGKALPRFWSVPYSFCQELRSGRSEYGLRSSCNL